MVFKDFEAGLPQFLPVLLEACEYTKRVGNRIATEFRRIRRASRLLLGRALKKARLRRLIILCERSTSGYLNEDEDDENFDVHCLVPNCRAWFDDNRGGVFAFHSELEYIERTIRSAPGGFIGLRDVSADTVDEAYNMQGRFCPDIFAFHYRDRFRAKHSAVRPVVGPMVRLGHYRIVQRRP